jgi:L-asparaginase II
VVSVPGTRADGPLLAARLHAGAAAVVAGAADDVASAAVPLARVVRGDLVESVHAGHLVVLAPDGSVRLALGDPEVTVLARSSLKPLQAVAMLRSGLDLDGEHLALACASHSGEPVHLAGVRAVLAGAGLDERALDNTPDVPLDPTAAFAWRTAGHGPEPVAQNCSGKHAAMLATCVARAADGWTTTGYRDAEHPLQVAVRDTIADLTGEPVRHATVDGCGAALFSTSLIGLARAFSTLATAPDRAPGSAEARVAAAMSAHPDLVGGTGRDVTRAMRAVPELVAKDGADGVYAAALPDGSAVAFKVADGSPRPRPAVLVAALLVAGAGQVPGVDPAELDDLGRTPVLGHGEPVGAVVPAFGAHGAGTVPGVAVVGGDVA